MNNIVTGTAAESTENQLLAAGLATNKLTNALVAQMNLTEHGSDQSVPQDFHTNVFWDNRASNGMVIGDGTLASPTELQGLGMHNAETWKFDIGSATGVPLTPSNSIIENAAIFNGTCDPPLPTAFGPRQFNMPPPFKCDITLAYGNPTVNKEIKWGVDTMTVQVQGLAVTLAGTNTFHMVINPALFYHGPIGDYFVSGTQGAMQSPPRPIGSRPIGFSTDDSGSSGWKHAFWLLLAVVPGAAYVYHAAASKKGNTTREPEPRHEAVYLEEPEDVEGVPNDEYEDRAALVNNRARPNRGSGRLLAFSMAAFGLSKQAAAHSDCTVDCVEQFIPIAPQVKYQTKLFAPPVLDMRTECNKTVDIYMKSSYQDFGIKDANGSTLLTQIYGYTTDPDGNATFPGPTIVTTKGCAINVTFHNKLGLGPHLFPMDRSINCGNANLNNESCAAKTFWNGTHDVPLLDPPLGADEDFYCRCTSAHGSERRTTTQ